MNKILIAVVFLTIVCVVVGCSKNKGNYELLNKFKALKYKDKKTGKTLPYRLYVPSGYNVKEKFPLILYLHGGGGNGKDNKSQIGSIAKKIISSDFQEVSKSFVLIPQCPKGEQWVNTTFKKTPYLNYDQRTIPESDSMKIIVKIISSLQKEYSIDRKRLYITGYSMGGSGTWDMITRYPDLFAAAVPVTGVSDPQKAKKVKDLPIWAFHGAKDEVSIVENTRNMIRAIRKYSNKCTFTEYENVGHDVWKNAYSEPDMIRWMFSKQK